MLPERRQTASANPAEGETSPMRVPDTSNGPAIGIMDRLKHRRDFLAAARGAKWAQPGLVLQARPRPEDGAEPRVGFTVTRKVGTAVTRNRARRRLRAAAQKVIPLCGKPGYDYVLIGRAGTLTRSFSGLVDDLKTALHRVHADKTRPAKSTKSGPHG